MVVDFELKIINLLLRMSWKAFFLLLTTVSTVFCFHFLCSSERCQLWKVPACHSRSVFSSKCVWKLVLQHKFPRAAEVMATNNIHSAACLADPAERHSSLHSSNNSAPKKTRPFQQWQVM